MVNLMKKEEINLLGDFKSQEKSDIFKIDWFSILKRTNFIFNQYIL